MMATAPMPRALPLLVVAALAACASSRPHWVTTEYDPEWEPTGFGWRTARSRHFVVHGQADARTLELAVARFEETRLALASFLFGDTEVPLVEAVILPPRDFDEVASTHVDGLCVRGVGQNGSLLVVRHIENWRYADMLLAHELAHRFVAARYRHLPSWFDEGLASFLESVEVRERELRFGMAPTTASHFQLGGGVSFKQLLEARPEDLYGPAATAYYSTAWAIIHHLLTEQGGASLERFRRLLELLEATRGNPSGALQAFRQVYPEQTIVELEEAAMSRAVRTSMLGVVRIIDFPFERPAPPPVALASADTKRLRLLMNQVRARFEAYRRYPARKRRWRRSGSARRPPARAPARTRP
jgi:hypothetical protein